MIKAVFFDIDGTLISFDTHRVPDSTVRAIEELTRKGIKVFIATGRHLKALSSLSHIPFDGYITLNGSYCVDADRNILFKKSIPASDIDSLIRYQKEVRSFPCVFVEEQSMAINEENDEVPFLCDLLKIDRFPQQDIDWFSGREVFQITAFFPKEDDEEVMRQLPSCSEMRWYPTFTDIIVKGADKAFGIDQICAHYGFSVKETMAFGDGGNDIPMIRHAGIGIAMGNASDEVKREADYVAASVDEDGVMKSLRHFGVID